MSTLDDYLNPNPETLRENWRVLQVRDWAAVGKRQVVFTPVETLLCLAASLEVNHRRFGSSTADSAPTPVSELAGLFKRPKSSILAKMANLDGSRAHGGRYDTDAASALRADLAMLGEVYGRVVAAARAAGIDDRVLPDFLGVERGGQPVDRTSAV